MEDIAGTVTGVALMSLILTKVVDTLRNMFDGPDQLPKWLWNVISLGLGVGAAFVWQLDATGLVSDTNIQQWVGQLLTGLGLGAAASGWHEVLDNISAGATAKRAGTTQPVATAIAADEVTMEPVAAAAVTPKRKPRRKRPVE